MRMFAVREDVTPIQAGCRFELDMKRCVPIEIRDSNKMHQLADSDRTFPGAFQQVDRWRSMATLVNVDSMLKWARDYRKY
jgi:hypothetical protein